MNGPSSTRKTWAPLDPFNPPEVVRVDIIDTEHCPVCGEDYDRLSLDNLRWIGSKIASIAEPVKDGFKSLFNSDDISQMFKRTNIEGIARSKKDRYSIVFKLNGIRAILEFQKVEKLFVALNLRRLYVS